MSSYKKALTTDQKEGAITWKDGNGQGSYVVPEPKPTPTPDPKPVTPVTPAPKPVNPNPVIRGAYDTPHMRGIRSAVVGNINAWRTLADDMYRPRVLQQGEPTGIWARIGGGKYSYSGSGIDTATDYTRIQGGYDAKSAVAGL